MSRELAIGEAAADMLNPRGEFAARGSLAVIELSPALLNALVAEVAARVLETLEPAASARKVSTYLTIEEATDLLRCPPQRIYDLRSSRRLTPFRDGTRALVSRAEVEAYLCQDERDRRRRAP